MTGPARVRVGLTLGLAIVWLGGLEAGRRWILGGRLPGGYALEWLAVDVETHQRSLRERGHEGSIGGFARVVDQLWESLRDAQGKQLFHDSSVQNAQVPLPPVAIQARQRELITRLGERAARLPAAARPTTLTAAASPAAEGAPLDLATARARVMVRAFRHLAGRAIQADELTLAFDYVEAGLLLARAIALRGNLHESQRLVADVERLAEAGRTAAELGQDRAETTHFHQRLAQVRSELPTPAWALEQELLAWWHAREAAGWRARSTRRAIEGRLDLLVRLKRLVASTPRARWGQLEASLAADDPRREDARKLVQVCHLMMELRDAIDGALAALERQRPVP